MKKPTEPTAITVLRQLIIGTNPENNGTKHVQKFARINGIRMVAVLPVIEDAIERRDTLLTGATRANAACGAPIVIYEDKYAETDDQRFNYAPENGYLILCPHAESLGKVIDGQFVPRMKTIWESDGTDGPVHITSPDRA